MEGILRLASYFPFPEVGVYRCIWTKRIYAIDPLVPVVSAHKLLGKPVDLQLPEFAFRVEKLSPPQERHQVPIPGLTESQVGELDTMRSEDLPEYEALKKAASGNKGESEPISNPLPDAKPLPSPPAQISNVVQVSPMPSLWWVWLILALAKRLLFAKR